MVVDLSAPSVTMLPATLAAHGALLKQIVALATQPGLDWPEYAATITEVVPVRAGRAAEFDRAAQAEQVGVRVSLAFAQFMADVATAHAEVVGPPG